MENIKLIIKGFIIGTGKIIPGVSGAMFAMMFGVYEKAIGIISDFKKIKGNFKFLFLLGTSVLFAILCSSAVIKTLLDEYYLYVMLLFVGMMAAGIKPLFNNIKNEKLESKNIIYSLLVVVILIGMSCIDVVSVTSSIENKLLTFLIISVCGFIDAFGTVIPGVCGTALLMLIGYYEKILEALSNLLTFTALKDSLLILIPFLIGLIIGVISVSKLINHLFNKHRTTTYCAIIGFAISSTIILLIKALTVKFRLYELLIGIVLFAIGYLIVYLLEGNWNKKSKRD